MSDLKRTTLTTELEIAKDAPPVEVLKMMDAIMGGFGRRFPRYQPVAWIVRPEVAAKIRAACGAGDKMWGRVDERVNGCHLEVMWKDAVADAVFVCTVPIEDLEG